jgi:LDH2 family malate/lactate/ureidoglycolate dehydrogenase
VCDLSRHEREPGHGTRRAAQKTLATTPWSWAAPAGKHAPMVLDIANTSVAPGANVIRCELPAREASAQGACEKAGRLDFEGY